jgi:hypothetical protein
MRTWDIQQGDCLDLLRALPDNCIDAIVTDPPYGLSPDGRCRTWDDIEDGRKGGGFMGKQWDAAVPGVTWARECLRVCKPGAHIVAFGGQRTIHRLICGLEDAGWEIRDLGAWQQWQGFPKSLAVGKAIDAHHGAEREVVGVRPYTSQDWSEDQFTSQGSMMQTHKTAARVAVDITAPATEDARKWEGYGTALKPCLEFWTLARKPLDGTVAENVLRWGVGCLNIDGCRYGYGDPAWPGPDSGENPGSVHAGDFGKQGIYGGGTRKVECGGHDLGRWPANVYACPKASRAEREAGCGHLKGRAGFEAVERTEGSAGLDNPRAGAGRTAGEVRNHHPTVKPAALMAWLCRLVGGQPGSLILDPFTGSGTTGIAALREGFRFLGFELDPEYIEIAEARITGDAPLFNRRESMLG